jgi:glycosyltransferase involved in cell wall biosynthesis
VTMKPVAHAGGRGVALLAPRDSILGHDPCGGSEVILWEDWRILGQAGISAEVYGRAAADGALVKRLRVRSNLPLVTSLEYCGQCLWKAPRSLVMAYNEPCVAGLAPDRSIIRFDWSTPLPRYWRLPAWLGRFRRSLYLFPSESERGIFLGAHPLIPEERAVVIPNAVDLEAFAPKAGHSVAPRVGFAGQWEPGKGLGVLLDAWEIVRAKMPEAELWLAGGAGLWKRNSKVPGAEEIVSRLTAPEARRIHLAGDLPRREMPGFWNSVAIAAVPSLREAFGLVALEAMACGLPVVASAVGGLREIVIEGESGLLLPPGDAGRLAEALLRLLTNSTERARLAAGARRGAQQFSSQRRSRELITLVERRTRESRTRGAAAAPAREELP